MWAAGRLPRQCDKGQVLSLYGDLCIHIGIFRRLYFICAGIWNIQIHYIYTYICSRLNSLGVSWGQRYPLATILTRLFRLHSSFHACSSIYFLYILGYFLSSNDYFICLSYYICSFMILFIYLSFQFVYQGIYNYLKIFNNNNFNWTLYLLHYVLRFWCALS